MSSSISSEECKNRECSATELLQDSEYTISFKFRTFKAQVQLLRIMKFGMKFAQLKGMKFENIIQLGEESKSSPKWVDPCQICPI